MIKFFRHIRKSLLMENKASKYFKYAIGEIVLVVIGILIALSLNTWNTQRLNTNRNQELLVKLSKELDLNIERARGLDSTSETSGFSNRYKFTDSLYSLLRHNMAIDHLDYMVSTSIFYINTFNLNSSIFQELKNTGSLYSIGSDSLVTEIQKYYQLCDRESFYNINYSKNVNDLKAKCFEGWFDFKYLYRENPDEALKHHPWISNPRSPQYIKFRQFVRAARNHHRLMSSKLNRIIKESEKLKALIALENSL
ncbi:DUF6090 family protein [Winogradskyella aurantia]|uniref:Uncharacterized protein n=1 Tax=Winogradskyella aurantia TaxID=1915063 RepID=A0A265URW4_9FLAO|nr:DUF6090 family protein [Winogradskyella aurantia]OZV68046.1 hypothetical protein CA834_10390 [Winogradskyella aurantia]